MKTLHERFGLSKTEAVTLASEDIERLIAEVKKNAQLELLNWAMKVCGTGHTIAMIRKVFHNRFVEISGEGEKA